jgi:hypothetical protein
VSIVANPGDDTTIDVKLQESDDDSTFTDITGATHSQIAGDAVPHDVQQFNGLRTKRYVRQVWTVAGTSPVIDGVGHLSAPKQSY